MAVCKAHTRSGQPCKAQAVTGSTVCRLHGAGGGQLQKVVAANTKHGRYSKFAPPAMLANYEQFLADPDHLNLSDEVAISRAALAAVMKDADATAEAVQRAVESVAKVAATETKRRATLSESHVVVAMLQVADVVLKALDRHISNTDEREAAKQDIRTGLAALLGRGGADGLQPA